MRRFIAIFGLLCVVCITCVYASKYTIYVKVPRCVESASTYTPGIIGSFNNWSESVHMTLVMDGEYEGYHMVVIEANANTDFKFRDADRSDWSNEIISPSAGGFEHFPGWHALDNNRFPDNASTIVFDYSDTSEYQWLACYSASVPTKPDIEILRGQHDMPVLYINTKDAAPVTSKEEYLSATYYLDSRGVEGVEGIASVELPDTLQIKGRGNYTWRDFEKKPYRLKLNNKTALLGLKKNKHFGLLAHADDWSAWMKNTLGFLLSEQIGLQWTPKQQPVEVVLNGDYIGLYMLTELIRVDKDRVAIVEQPDLCTNQDSVTGGWLVEIDNYREEGNVEITEPEFLPYHGSRTAMFTPKTPEILSAEQRSYLTNAVQAIQDAVYSESDADFARLVNIEELAKFYLVQEIMSNCESFNGSCYLHKNIGADEQWYFGPVWDFGNSYNRNDGQTIYEGESMFAQKWIARMMQHEVLREAVQKEWDHWRYYEAANVASVINAMKERISKAAVRDAKRWPQYNHSDVDRKVGDILNRYSSRVSMLTSEWGEGMADVVTEVQNDANRTAVRKVFRDGQIVIVRDGVEYTLLGY